MGRSIQIGLVSAMILAAIEKTEAAESVNGFASIAERNVFRLVPFAPLPPPEKPPAPPKVLPKVIVTGITDVGGESRALLEMTEPGQVALRPVLREGERTGSLEVLSIDVDRGVVKVRLLGDEMNLRWPASKTTTTASLPARGEVRR